MSNENEFEEYDGIFMLVTFLICICAFAYNTWANNDEIVTEEVTIRAGETLYQVVADKVNNKNDINEVVSHALFDANIQDAGNIQPNQKIMITYKK